MFLGIIMSIYIIPFFPELIFFRFFLLFCFGVDALHYVGFVDDVFYQKIMESWFLGDGVDTLECGDDMPTKG